MRIVVKLGLNEKQLADSLRKDYVVTNSKYGYIIQLEELEESVLLQYAYLKESETPKPIDFSIPSSLTGKKMYVDIAEIGSIRSTCSAIICGINGEALKPYWINKNTAYFSLQNPFVVIHGYLSNFIKIYKYSITVKNNIATIQPTEIDSGFTPEIQWGCDVCCETFDEDGRKWHNKDNCSRPNEKRQKVLFCNHVIRPFGKAIIASLELAETLRPNQPFYYLD